jgi:hypothetical protein
MFIKNCPKCRVKLNHMTADECHPDFLYCPECQDVGYDPETGEPILLLTEGDLSGCEEEE